MPWGDPDPTDPSVLVGVTLPGDAASTQLMAEVFADEFARLGYDERGIFALFEDPFYAGAHAARAALGVPAVLRIIQDAVARWPRIRVIDAGQCGTDSGKEGQ
jgi:hypothetical protein